MASILEGLRRSFAPAASAVSARVAMSGTERLKRLARVRIALESFPALADLNRRAVFRRLIVTRACTRLVNRAMMACPQGAMAFARLMPVVGRSVFATVARDQPIILACMHFGPSYFIGTAMRRVFPQRNVYVLYRGAPRIGRFISANGNVPVDANGTSVLKTLTDIVARDPSCVLIISYDYLGESGRGRRMAVDFLGSQITVPMGLAHLARLYRATVIEVWCEFFRFGPRIAIGRLHHADRNLEPVACEEALTRRLFEALEARVRATPHDWTQWSNCAG